MEERNSILIVEDDLNNINLLIKAFGEEYQLFVADNGIEGIQLAAKHRPDIILLDILMPGVDGLEVCDRIKEQEELEHIPVLFMTALAEFENMETGFEHGGADYITKPFRLDEVKARVRAQMKVHRSIKKKYLQDKETEIRKALDEAVRKSEEVDRLKTAFLANLSHEIRTPLSAIVGFCELMRKQEYPFEVRSQYLDIIRNNADQLLFMVNDILDISMLASGQLTLMPEKMEVNELLHSLIMHFSDFPGAGPDQNVALDLDFPPGLKEIWVTADPKRLKQILHNLLHNACKFTKEGQVSIRLRIQDDNKLLFHVEDTGIGISPEKQKSIFEAFWQGETQYTREYGGTGMGLTIVKNLVNLMDGTIEIESAPGEGTRVSISIPFDPITTKEGEPTGKETYCALHRGNHGLI